MKDTFELEFSSDGSITSIYDEDIVRLLESAGGHVTKIGRASLVEWEKTASYAGWTVRAAHNRELAIREGSAPGEGMTLLVASFGKLAVFPSRKAALEAEERFFWQLLQPKGM